MSDASASLTGSREGSRSSGGGMDAARHRKGGDAEGGELAGGGSGGRQTGANPRRSETSSMDELEVAAESQPAGLFVFVQAYLVLIAIILGSGILALPVELAESGFWPFVINYVVCLTFQSLALLFYVEVLQFSAAVDAGTAPGRTQVKSPDLHTAGSLFLGPIAGFVFDVLWVIALSGVLISYALAGSQAWGQLLGMSPTVVVTPFFLIFTATILFGQKVITVLISVLTFFKGSLLVLMVLVTAVVAGKVARPVENNFAAIASPFLLSTVALGGGASVVPVVFAKITPTIRRDVKRFRWGIIGGLATVAVLTTFWAFFILRIVPQTGSPSLEEAKAEGQIATIPLVAVIQSGYPEYNWIALCIEIFIMVSITVSYLTAGSGIKNLLDGVVYMTDKNPRWRHRIPNALSRLGARRAVLYVLAFGVIYVIALANPHGFIQVLEVGVSLGLNATAAFGCFMAGNSRRASNAYHIALALPDWVYTLRWPTIFYFTLAVVYDLVSLLFSIFE